MGTSQYDGVNHRIFIQQPVDMLFDEIVGSFRLIFIILYPGDPSSSSRFITGGCAKSVTELDLKTLGVVMEINGKVVQTGAGAAVLGHPAASVAMLANMLAERGEYLPAGSFVMIGAITAAVQVEKGDAFVVHFQDLGSISGRFE